MLRCQLERRFCWAEKQGASGLGADTPNIVRVSSGMNDTLVAASGEKGAIFASPLPLPTHTSALPAEGHGRDAASDPKDAACCVTLEGHIQGRLRSIGIDIATVPRPTFWPNDTLVAASGSDGRSRRFPCAIRYAPELRPPVTRTLRWLLPPRSMTPAEASGPEGRKKPPLRPPSERIGRADINPAQIEGSMRQCRSGQGRFTGEDFRSSAIDGQPHQAGRAVSQEDTVISAQSTGNAHSGRSRINGRSSVWQRGTWGFRSGDTTHRLGSGSRQDMNARCSLRLGCLGMAEGSLGQLPGVARPSLEKGTRNLASEAPTLRPEGLTPRVAPLTSEDRPRYRVACRRPAFRCARISLR